jgi:hypothetical protein
MKKLTSCIPTFAISHCLCLIQKKKKITEHEHLLGVQVLQQTQSNHRSFKNAPK